MQTTAEQPASTSSGSQNLHRSAKQRFSTSEIFKGDSEVLIEHAGDEYRLRITKKGRLILTK